MSQATSILLSVALLVGSILLGLLLISLTTRIISRWHSKKPFVIRGMRLRIEYWHSPLRAIVPAALLAMALPFLRFPAGLLIFIRHLLALWMIASIAWFVIRTIAMARDMILSRYDLAAEDSMSGRGVYTQVRVFDRLLRLLILVFAAAAMLMSFSSLREFGLSILASAGLAGLVIGFAAQRSIATLLAGMHIAITQPIRLQDAVLVEGEFGNIEEITLSYVVIRLWDERRLIVPISHFIEKSFENWTRKSSALIGTVFLYCDYRIPVQELRNELFRIVKSSDLWNRKVCALQVTGAAQDGIELRALCSADDASRTWDLRCYVREKLIEYMQARFPESLPQTRIRLSRPKPKTQSPEEVRTAA